MTRHALTGLLGAGWMGCAPTPVATATPGAGSMTGYYPVSFALQGVDPADVATATLGGIAVYDLEAEGDTLRVMIQGAPASGPADLVVSEAGGDTITFADAFTFDEPLDSAFDAVVMVGASLAQGVQGGVPTHSGGLHNPGLFVARALGAYQPFPLLHEDLFSVIAPADIGPPPDCAIPDIVSHIASGAIEVLDKLNDPVADRIALDRARVDPAIQLYNVAVGGSMLADLVHGPGDSFEVQFLTKLVYDPFSDIFEVTYASQLDMVEALQPTLILSPDLYGNDLIGSVVFSNVIDPSEITDLDEARADMEALCERLTATGAQSFLGNMPRITLLPATWDKRQIEIDDAVEAAIEQGADLAEATLEAEADVDARIAEIESIGQAYNDALAEIAAGYPSVHVVDFAGRVAEMEAEPLVIDGVTLTVEKLGGLLSTDGVHFSDVGYGVLGSLFLETIEGVLGVTLPRVDQSGVLADDPFTPDAMVASGLDPDCLP